MSGNNPEASSHENSIIAIRQNHAEDENTWVFESLVGFLTSLIWNIPMEDFVENKSMVFEDSEEHEEEYHKIHEEYKYMVDSMLSGFMQDLGITPEQFAKACNDAEVDIKIYHLKETIFQEIWAADDYDIFVKMMIRRNAALQLQALEYLNAREGTEAKTHASWARHHDDDNELQEAIRQSFEEHQKSNFEIDREKDVLEKIMKETREEEQHRLETERLRESKLLEQAIKLSLSEPPEENSSKTVEDGNARNSPKHEQPTKYTLSSVIDDKPMTEAENTTNKTASPDEIEKRRAYLLLQRDKLLARKHQEHKEQLQKEAIVRKCPSSARVAKKVLENQDNNTNSITAEVLAARRALAARLRTEVVEKE